MTKISDFSEQGLGFKEKPKGWRFQDLEGQKFGRLTVIGFVGDRKWHCKCDCGNQKRVAAYSLKGGATKSCGCFNIQRVKEVSTTHGHSKVGNVSPTYRTWMHMKNRCCNPNNPDYPNYGGRGIKVCDRWLNSFENFLSDMAIRPKGMTIERIENDGNYTPENCRYATRKEQANNTRRNHLLTFNEKTQTMAKWAEETGISQNTIERRLNKYGWTIGRALTT